MRKYNILAFDDFVSATANAYSTTDLNDVLGDADQTAIMAVVDQATGGGVLTFQVQIEESGDGRNWISKNVNPEINNASMAVNTTSVVFGSDTGTAPSARLVRLRVSLNATAGVPDAHLKIWMCGRDKGKGRAARPLPTDTAPSLSSPMSAIGVSSRLARGTASMPAAAGRVDPAGRPIP
jgi:hypothetical protein